LNLFGFKLQKKPEQFLVFEGHRYAHSQLLIQLRISIKSSEIFSCYAYTTSIFNQHIPQSDLTYDF
jgi:hypothetical protein